MKGAGNVTPARSPYDEQDLKVFQHGYRQYEVLPDLDIPKQITEGSASLEGEMTWDLPRRKPYRKLPFGAVPGYCPICPDDKNVATVKSAFMKRIVRDTPVVNYAVLERFRRFVGGFLESHVRHVRPLGFEEWLLTTSYNEQRKQQLRDAHDHWCGGRPDRKTCKKIKSFMKTESYPEYKYPRVINSRVDDFKAFSGPYFKAIEDEIFSLPWFVKHIPIPDRAAAVRRLRKSGMRYYATDFTSFECGFSAPFMRACECQMYEWCIQDEDMKFICDVICGQNEMSTRTGVRATITARRMSGDMCTSLGNGFSNLMLQMFIVHEQGCHYDGLVEGDDGLFSTEAVLTEEQFADLGFIIKIDEVDDPCHASFCGLIFSESGQIIRDPRRFLQTFGWTHSFLGARKKIMNELLRAKALSAVYETPQCPIVGALARKALLLTEGCEPRFEYDGYHDLFLKEILNQEIATFKPSDDTRCLFEQLYGVSVVDQVKLEKEINLGQLSNIPNVLVPTRDQYDCSAKYVAY